MTRLLERGDIFFFYRPKVDVRRVHGLHEVQRFYVILKPDDKNVFRRVVVGRKRLPSVREHERTWAFVDRVGTRPDEVEDRLDPRCYRTKTRGVRFEAPARPAGEGVYAIADHDRHTHLVHVLELPGVPGPVQRELHICEQASFIVAVRNPDVHWPPGAPRTGRPDYPDDLRAKFAGRRFADLDPPEFLDHVGTELVLIGASQGVAAELGIDLRPGRETEESADVFRELGIEKESHPVKPLLTGEWE